MLRRGQDMTSENQRENIKLCVESLAPVLESHRITIVHGNGPQVGMLVLEDEKFCKEKGLKSTPLVSDAYRNMRTHVSLVSPQLTGRT